MKKRPREPKPLLPALVSATGPALIKHLASCNTTVRGQSLRLLQSWLATESQHLSDPDIKKLWKGLFYCLWHADKTPNQVALIHRITSLFISLQPSICLEFFRGFVVTLRREWPGIDRLRLDKFYLLIRKFMRALFELMRLRKWDVEVLGEFLGVLENCGFLAEDKFRGNGVNYHVVAVFLEELKGVGFFPVRGEVVDVILRPFFAVMMRTEDRILFSKVKSCVFDELVKAGKVVLEKKRMGVDLDEKNGDLFLGVVALKMGLSKRFYEVGSSVGCVQGNRKMVLGLHEEFLKLEKELELYGLEIAIPEYSETQLIPIDFNTSNGNLELLTREVDEGQFDKTICKKTKKRKRRRNENGVSEINFVIEENGDLAKNLQSLSASRNSLSNDLEIDGSAVALSETVLFNLQKQFQKVAAEVGSDSDEGLTSRKRKRTKVSDSNQNTDAAANSVEKSAKRVRFCMKNNVFWKPQNPLPPRILRLPPSVNPRGSALKKGVPPGPVVEMPPPVKKKPKQKKKAQNRLKKVKAVAKNRKKMSV